MSIFGRRVGAITEAPLGWPSRIRDDGVKVVDKTGSALVATTEPAAVAPTRSIASAKLSPAAVRDPKSESYLDEYDQLAAALGVVSPDRTIERFKRFLNEKDIPVFSLDQVIAYMDKRAREEGTGLGWEWRPLREKDHIDSIEFGSPSQVDWSTGRRFKAPASDYYRGATLEDEPQSGGDVESFIRRASSLPYEHTVPLHALRKVLKIEKEFPDRVAFFVSDYALAPHVVVPDPFLMAVIPNPRVKTEGRFVIDFWDEPGFGIEAMLK